MKRNLFLSTAIGALLLGSTPAIAQDPFSLIPKPSSLYLSLFTGVAFVDDYSLSTVAGGTPFSVSLESDPGYIFGIALGTELTKQWRAEIEYAYTKSDLDTVTIAAPMGVTFPVTSGDIEVQTVMFNLWYDFSMNSVIRPYIGGGIGYGNVEIGSADSDGFAFQVGVGARYALTKQLDLDLSYRFKDILDVGLVGGFDEDDVQSHNLQAALTFRF